jgi:hypothetical protein
MGGSYRKVAKVLNPIPFISKPLKGTTVGKWTNIPLNTWVSGEKTFDDSLRTSGTPVEQSINRWLLTLMGRDKKNTYIPPKTKIPEATKFNNNVMMSNLLEQQKKTDAQSLSTIKDSFAAQNAMQQSNVDANMTRSASQPLGSRAPVKTTFTPANTFSAPDTNGLTFGGG